MFWGIALEHGNIYSQIVEQPFHISMAALGFENLTPDATTVMVESEKAGYALCTLQAGKIPQQPLDLNFTEGEEVKFYLEGNGGVVHLTGYLLETPREYEFDDDDSEGLLSSEDNATSSDSDHDDMKMSNMGDNEKDPSEDDLEMSGTVDIEQGKPSKKADEESESEDSDHDGSEIDVSWRIALNADIDGSLETSDSDDDDWDPQKTSKKLPEAKNLKLKGKNSKQKKQPLSQTLVDLMDIGDDESEESSDEEWAPQKDKSEASISTDGKDISVQNNVCKKFNGDVSS